MGPWFPTCPPRRCRLPFQDRETNPRNDIEVALGDLVIRVSYKVGLVDVQHVDMVVVAPRIECGGVEVFVDTAGARVGRGAVHR